MSGRSSSSPPPRKRQRTSENQQTKPNSEWLPTTSSMQHFIVQSRTREDKMAQAAELAELNVFFGQDLANAVGVVASSNTLLHSAALCLPVEIGAVRFSLRNGIIEEFHSLVNPNWPNTDTLLSNLYRFLQPNHGGAPVWIFIEDSEFDKTRNVFKWCEIKSEEQGMNVVWNYRIIPLSSVWLYLSNRLIQKPDEGQAIESGKWVNTQLACDYHRPIEYPNCAKAKSYVHCFTVLSNLAPYFGVNLMVGRHFAQY